MEIIPAIDLIDGKCVRLTQGDYSQKKIYEENPLKQAKVFEGMGFTSLHLVDLDGAKAGSPQNLLILEKIASQTNLKIDFGGGLKTESDLNQVWNAGADMATIGSIAVKDPELVKSWMQKFDLDKILLAADVKDEKIALNAWQDTSELSIFDFIEAYLQEGLTQFFCTDVSKDGLLKGTNVDLYQKLKKKFPNTRLIASGGVSSAQDLKDLQKIEIEGVIVGKALYEGRISQEEIDFFIKNSSCDNTKVIQKNSFE